MLMHQDGLLFRVLFWLQNPTQYLPPLFPMWTERARVGTNTTDYLMVRFSRKPPRCWSRRTFGVAYALAIRFERTDKIAPVAGYRPKQSPPHGPDHCDRGFSFVRPPNNVRWAFLRPPLPNVTEL